MATKKFKSDVQIDQNLKLPSQTSQRAIILDASGNVSSSAVTATELGYVSGLSSAVQTQLDAKASLVGGKIPSSQLPAIGITEVFVVADIAARDSLTVGTGDGEVQEGDVVKVNDASADPDITSGAASYIYDGSAYQLLKAGDEVLSVNGATGIVVITASDVNYTQGNVAHWTTASGGSIKLHLDEVADRLNTIETNFFDTTTDNSDNITEGSTNLFMSGAEQSKLGFITITQAVDLDNVEQLSLTALQNGDNITELSNNAGFVDAAAAKAASVVNSTAGNETDQAASVQAMKDYVASNSPGSSAGDIAETSFAAANNQASAVSVTGLAFASATVRSFSALVSVEIDATSDLFEQYTLEGVQTSIGFSMSVSSTGDNSGVEFSITSAGQVQYTSTDVSGYVSSSIKFRAITTTV